MRSYIIVIGVCVLFSSCGQRYDPEVVTLPPGPGGTASTSMKVPILALRLTPDEAYVHEEHRRTVLNLDDSKLDASVRRYVEEMFACIDEGTALRVTTLDDFFAGERDIAKYSKAHKQLKSFIQSRKVPASLREYHKKLLEAFDAQSDFFVEWAEVGASFSEPNVFSHEAVKRCSKALHAAYAIIQQQVGPQAANQRQAFYDYHCALDFL